MEVEKQKPRSKSQGFKSGLLFGLIVGCGAFLLTVKLVHLVSQ